MDPQAVVEHAHSDVNWGVIFAIVGGAFTALTTGAAGIGAWYTLRSRVKTVEDRTGRTAKTLGDWVKTSNGTERAVMQTKLEALEGDMAKREENEEELFNRKNELFQEVTLLKSLFRRVQQLEDKS